MGLSLRKLGSRITDIFDANSGADQKKRKAAGQARLYADQQRALGNSRPANNVGQAFLGNAARTINTGIGIARETPGTFRAGIGMATGNQQAVNDALADIKKAQVATRNPNAGLFGAGTIYKNANDTPLMGETAKRFGTSYLAGAGELAPIPATKAIKGANLGVKALKVGAASGAANVAADAGNQYINTGKIDLKRSAIAGGTGFALGTAAPLAWAGTKVAAKGVANSANKALDVKLSALNEAGGINNPAVKELQSTRKRMQVQWDKASGQTRKQIEKAMKGVDKEIKKLDERGGAKAGDIIPDKAFRGEPAPKVPEPVQSPVVSSPNNTPVFQDAINAADSASGKYAETGLGRRAESKVNPLAPLARIDKAAGYQRGSGDTSKSLEHLANVFHSSGRQADENMKKHGIDKIIQHYGGDSIQGKDFNQYMNHRFAAEVAQKTGKKIIYDDAGNAIPVEKLLADVAQYEKVNPLAKTHAGQIKQWSNVELDRAVKAGLIKKEAADHVKSFYENYVPLERVLPEELTRPTINASPMGSIGQQTVLQNLEGSKMPLSSSFERLVSKGRNTQRQINKVAVAQQYLEDVRSGAAPGNILLSPEQAKMLDEAKVTLKGLSEIKDKTIKAKNKVAKKTSKALASKKGVENKAVSKARDELRAALNKPAVEASKELNKLGNKKSRLVTKKAVATVKQQNAEKLAVKKAKDTLLKQTDDVDARAAISNLSTKDLLEVLDNSAYYLEPGTFALSKRALKAGNKTKAAEAELQAVESARESLRSSLVDKDAQAAVSNLSKPELIDVFKMLSEDGNNARLLESLNKKSSAHAALASELDNLRGLRNQLKEEVKAARSDVAELSPPSATGMQTISGLSEGYPFKIEVPPEIAKVLQGLEQEKLNTVLKFMTKAWYPFRMAFTGLLNPVFSAMSFVLYDTPMSVINSPQGARVFGAKAVTEMFKSFNSQSAFQKKLAESGAQVVTSTLVPGDVAKSVSYIASRKDLFSKVKFSLNPKNIGQVANDVDVFGAKLQNATRTRTAKAAYDKVLADTGDEAQAMAAAAYDFNNVLPNYQNASSLLRQIDSIVPYAAASVAGTRSAGQAIRRRPGQAALGVAGILIAPSVASTAFSLSQDEGQAFYKDMEDSGKTYVLDNNMIVVLPGAYKDDKTGEWHGIVKIPVAPEFRGANQVVWRQTRDAIQGNGLTDPRIYAGAVADSATGGLSPINPVTGKARPSVNPAVSDVVAMATNTDLQTGRQIVPDYLKDEPTNKQVSRGTGGISRKIGNATGVSPMKIQYLINSTGLAGKSATSGAEQLLANKGVIPKDQVSSGLKDQVTRKFVGAYGTSSGGRFFKQVDQVAKGITNQDDRKVFQGLHAQRDKNAKSPDKQAEKYKIYLARPDVFKAEKKLNDYNKKTGQPANPLFDLTPEQQNAVMRYRGAKDLNSAKQAYDKNGNPLFTALGLDEKWYDDFRTKEGDFYAKIKGTDAETNPLTYSGAVKPKDNPAMDALKDQYYALPKGTGERSSFLKSHPELLASWADDNQFTNAERIALGLKVTEDATYGGSSSSSYASGGGSGGGGSGSSDPYKYAVSLNQGSVGKPKAFKVSKGKAIAKKKIGKIKTKSVKSKV